MLEGVLNQQVNACKLFPAHLNTSLVLGRGWWQIIAVFLNKSVVEVDFRKVMGKTWPLMSLTTSKPSSLVDLIYI